jgi:hypothetical protein
MSFASGLPQSKVTVEARTSKAYHSEHEKQRDGYGDREKQRSETAQPVREEEKHRGKPCGGGLID